MGLFGIAFPWETPAGEGFIAPWTPQAVSSTGLITQAAAAAPTQAQTWATQKAAILAAGGTPVGMTAEQASVAALTAGQEVPASVAQILDMSSWVDSTQAAPVSGGGLAPVAVGSTVAKVAGAGAVATGIAGILALLASRIKFPWQTPTGEGFIAPWQEQELLPSGEWGVVGKTYNGNGAATGLPAGMRSWTNASKDGSSPATVQFVQDVNGRIYSLSLITGRIKSWRPKKHVVISSNPRVSSLKKLNTLNKKVSKMLKPFQPKGKGLSADALAKAYLSTAERKLLAGGK